MDIGRQEIRVQYAIFGWIVKVSTMIMILMQCVIMDIARTVDMGRPVDKIETANPSVGPTESVAEAIVRMVETEPHVDKTATARAKSATRVIALNVEEKEVTVIIVTNAMR
jgi:hypothetical protein